MKTTPYSILKKLSFLIVFTCLFTHCSDIEDFDIDKNNILGVWNFDKAIDTFGEETELSGTVEFLIDGSFILIDNTILNGNTWDYQNSYYNPELYFLSAGSKEPEILELTSKNMVWRFEYEVVFLSKE